MLNWIPNICCEILLEGSNFNYYCKTKRKRIPIELKTSTSSSVSMLCCAGEEEDDDAEKERVVWSSRVNHMDEWVGHVARANLQACFSKEKKTH